MMLPQGWLELHHLVHGTQRNEDAGWGQHFMLINGGSGGMWECGKIKISLSKHSFEKILLNYIKI